MVQENTNTNTQVSILKKKLKILKNIGIAVILCLILWVNSAYTIKETETAIITTFGVAKASTEKGLNFKIPFIQHLKKVDTTVQGLTIGYRTDKDGVYQTVSDESTMITSDYNFIDIDFYISYYVSDAIKYAYASNNPKTILKNIAMSSIRSVISAYPVDAALTVGKAEIQANIKQMIINELEKVDIGITLVDAPIQDVEPPVDYVKDAFTAVETAKQNKESAINEANKYRNEQIPKAEAEADEILQAAEAYKTARINEATGQVARFEEEYKEYKKFPLITKQRMFYETMDEILPNLKIIIDDGSGTVSKVYPVEAFSSVNTTVAGSETTQE